jgi:hypothetical protein
MCASCSGREAAFFSARGASLSEEAAYDKINVQSACALKTLYNAKIRTFNKMLRVIRTPDKSDAKPIHKRQTHPL